MSDEPPKTTPLEDLPAGELPIGTSLNSGQYKVKQVIASGGFGITYLAEDNLGRDVALKECFPLGLATRTAGKSVSAASSSTADSFETARDLFLREARLLARLAHPNVVHVQTLFEENGTAYMAMDFIHGHDLHDVVSKTPERLTPDRVMNLARTMLGALGYLHGESCLHRDIKPSNIRIDRYGTPILIDFGAARQETQLRSRLAGSFRVVSDGYSPNEFYISGAEQGPGSDLYSFGATLYFVVSGKAPAAADARAQKVATGEPDPYEPLSGRFPEHDAALLEMIDRSMAMSLKDRPADAETWLSALSTPEPATAPAPLAMPMTDSTPQGPGFRTGIGIGAAAAAVLAGGLFIALPGDQSGGSETEVARLMGDLDMETAEVTRLQTELDAAEAEVDRLTAELDELRSTGGGSETEIARLTRERDAATARVSALEATNARLRDEIAGLMQGGSGGATTPGTGPTPVLASGLQDLRGEWSLIATCPAELMQSLGLEITRIFGNLNVTSHAGAQLSGTYENNFGETATVSGRLVDQRVDWMAVWTSGERTTISLDYDAGGQAYTGEDGNGCALTGSRTG